jgi:hypothetical protein
MTPEVHSPADDELYQEECYEYTCMLEHCCRKYELGIFLKLVVCILLRVLGQVQGFRLTQNCFEYFIQ